MKDVIDSIFLTLSFVVELFVIKYMCRKHKVPTDISIFLYIFFYLLIFGYSFYTVYQIFMYVKQVTG